MSVTPAMIAVALGVTAPDSGSPQEAQWQMLVEDALMLIEARRIDLGVDPLDEAKVDYVVRNAVVDHIRHPDSATQVTVAVDDASTSRTYRSGAGRVRILDEWWALLGLTPSGGGIYSVDTAACGTSHQPWCNLAFGALYCSCGADLAGFPLWEY